MAEVNVVKDVENKTLTIEYLANGPKEKVWKAYSNKEWFEKWWGPEGWETTTKEFDFRPGGRVHYDMHCVDKNQGEWYDQHSWGVMEIQSINEGSSFTYKDSFSDESGQINDEMPSMIVTNEFIEVNGKTKIVCRNVADSIEQLDELLKMGVVEGYGSQLNKLDALFAEN